MSSAKSKLCIRLVANLVLAVTISVVAATLFIGYKTLSETTDRIARASTNGCVSEDAQKEKLQALLDKAIENSREKDAIILRLLYLFITSYAILLLASTRNVQLAFILDRSKQTLLHHFASAFAKIFRCASLALHGDASKTGALVYAKSISGVQLDYIEKQRMFALKFNGYDKKSSSVFSLTIAAWEIFRGRQDETPQLELLAEIPDDEILVKAHEELVGSIIDNLLGNATKYTERGSVTLALSQKGRNVFISVADTGRGISREMQKKMYKPHVRDYASIDKEGSGWGLHEVMRAVKNYGGKIKCESEIGKGTKFTVTLPIALRESPPKVGRNSEKMPKSNNSPPPPKNSSI